MKEISITDLSFKVLDALSVQRALSAKEIAEFERCGLRPILKYFAENGWPAYSEENVWEYVLMARASLERGELKAYRWTYIRRAAVYLREYASTGILPDRPLPKWESEHNALLQEPSAGDEGSNELLPLVQNVRKLLTESSLSAKSVQNYTYDGLGRIVQFFAERGATVYSQELLEQFVEDSVKKLSTKEICLSCFQNRRKAAHWLREYRETGTLSFSKLPSRSFVAASPPFEELIDEFREWCVHRDRLEISSSKVYAGAIRSYFKKLESLGVREYCSIDLKAASKAILIQAKTWKGGFGGCLDALRCFARFIAETHPELPDISPALNGTPAAHKKVIIGFTEQELRAILGAIDRSIAKGKRDYAMIQLAHATGLRAVDIIQLRLKDIDRKERAVRIIQSKTGVPIALPLDDETILAIDDYIFRSRPESEDDHLFLRAVWPYTKLTGNSWGIVAKYATAAFGKRNDRQYGFHSIRRGLGQRMLEAQVPVSVICDVLGHKTRHAVLQYTSASISGLRLCAGSLAAIPVEQEELQ